MAVRKVDRAGPGDVQGSAGRGGGPVRGPYGRFVVSNSSGLMGRPLAHTS
jgi:hypothetical protein